MSHLVAHVLRECGVQRIPQTAGFGAQSVNMGHDAVLALAGRPLGARHVGLPFMPFPAQAAQLHLLALRISGYIPSM